MKNENEAAVCAKPGANPTKLYLFLLNKPKQTAEFRLETNTIWLRKGKKEKSLVFNEIFLTEDALTEHFSQILDLKSLKASENHVILLCGAKKTRKKLVFIEILEQLVINFLDILRNKCFPLQESEENHVNFEVKANYEQFPADSLTKDLTFSLNSQFYVSQMISHHQKLTNSIESSFNRFKSSLTKRSYLPKPEVIS